MTSMPAIGASTFGAPGCRGCHKGPGKPVMAFWYAICMCILANACFYTGSMVLIDPENNPPEIISWSDGSLFCDDETLSLYGSDAFCLEAGVNKVYVTAVDADDDLLEFFWEGSWSGVIGTAVTTYSGEFQNSQVTISTDDVVDGEQLQCMVSDGSGDRTTHSWILVVI